MSKRNTIANVRVGRADVRPTLPSHVSGVKQGNRSRNHGEEPTDPRRSTGINPQGAAPIDPSMPKLTPP